MANLIGPLVGGLLTVAIDWRACWWFFIPVTAAVAWGMYRFVPRQVHADETPETAGLRQRVIAAAALIAALTFVVMIGAFFIAQQYLQIAVGYSALGAAAALTVIAVLVGVAAPLAGRLSDARGERPVAMLGWLLAAIGMAALGIPGVSLVRAGNACCCWSRLASGSECCSCRPRAPRSMPSRSPATAGCRRCSRRRACWAPRSARFLAGAALASGVTAHNVHVAMLIGAAACLLIGIPVSSELPSAGGQPALDGDPDGLRPVAPGRLASARHGPTIDAANRSAAELLRDGQTTWRWLRGKSGHHRAGRSVTPTRGNPRESATEKTPPKLGDHT